MRDAYDHAEYVGKDIARYEQARQVFKGTQPGYEEWQLVTNENGHDSFAVRILSRSEVPQARGVWCLADHYRRTGDHLLAGGYRVYLGLWDEGRGTREGGIGSVLRSYGHSREANRPRVGTDPCPGLL